MQISVVLLEVLGLIILESATEPGGGAVHLEVSGPSYGCIHVPLLPDSGTADASTCHLNMLNLMNLLHFYTLEALSCLDKSTYYYKFHPVLVQIIWPFYCF